MLRKQDGREYVDSINLVQDADKWLTLVNTILNLWVPLNVGNCWLAEELSSSALCS